MLRTLPFSLPAALAAHATVLLGSLLLAGSAAPVPAQAPAVDERPAAAGEWGFRPRDGATAETNPPAFVWRPQPDAASYEWQASRDRAFSSVEHRREGEPFNVHCPPEPFEAGIWFWRFRYRQGGAADPVSAWSRVRSFTLGAELPVFAIPARDELLRRVPDAHPRLFVRPADLPRLRALAQGELREHYAELVRACQKLIESPPPTGEPERYPPGMVRGSDPWRELWWGNRRRTIAVLDGATQLAFVWRIGGDEACGALAKRLLLDAARWDPRGATGYRYNDEAGMPYAYHFSRCYTFLHELLTEDERAICRQVMAVRGREMYRHLCPRHLWQPYNSHANRAWHFLGEVAIAFHGEIPEADDWLDFAMRVFGAVYPVWSDTDGGWHEGMAYWRSYLGRFTWWADVMRAAVGVDAYRKPFFARVGDFAMYVEPPGTRGGGFGDLCGRLESSGGARLVGLFAAQARNPYWQWYRDAHQDVGPEPGFVGFLRSAAGSVEPRPPADLPASKCFRGTGLAALNLNLERAVDNVQVLFKSSPLGSQSHGYEAQNSFLLYAFGERLAIRSGRRDSYGSEHHRGWMWSTRSVNSITVSGEGQVPHSARAAGAITEFSTAQDFDYVEGEAGGAYGGRLSRFTRSILFAKPSWIVVFDRLEAPVPETYEWWLHAEQPMRAIGAREVELRSGAAACRVRWLWPAELALTRTDRFDPPPRPRVKLVEHHLSAATTAPARAVTFVTVMRPFRVGRADDAGEDPAPDAPIGAVLTPLAGGHVVELRDGDRRTVVLLRTEPGAELRSGTGGVTSSATVAAVRLDAGGAATATFASRDGSVGAR